MYTHNYQRSFCCFRFLCMHRTTRDHFAVSGFCVYTELPEIILLFQVSVYTQNYQRSFCCFRFLCFHRTTRDNFAVSGFCVYTEPPEIILLLIKRIGSRASMSITHCSSVYMCVCVCVRVFVDYVYFFQIIYVYIFLTTRKGL